MPTTSLAQPNLLFLVTLAWNSNGSEEGDYADKTWAPDADAAIRNIAEEMADSGQVSFDDDAEREKFIEALIAGAGSYAAQEVSLRILPDVHEIMTGGEDDLSPEAIADYKAVAAIMAKYGASNGQQYP